MKSIYLHKKSHRRVLTLLLSLFLSLFTPPLRSLCSCPFVFPVWIRCLPKPDQFGKAGEFNQAMTVTHPTEHRHPPNRAQAAQKTCARVHPWSRPALLLGRFVLLSTKHFGTVAKKNWQSCLPPLPYASRGVDAAT